MQDQPQAQQGAGQHRAPAERLEGPGGLCRWATPSAVLAQVGQGLAQCPPVPGAVGRVAHLFGQGQPLARVLHRRRKVTLAGQQVGQLGQGADLFLAVAQLASQGQRFFQRSARLGQPPDAPQLAQDVVQQGRVAHLAGQAHGLVQGVERLLPLGRRGQKAGVGAQARQAAGQGRRVAQVAGQGQRLGLSSRRPTGRHLGLVVGQVPQGLELGGGIPFAAGCRQRCPVCRQRAFQVAAIVPQRPPTGTSG